MTLNHSFHMVLGTWLLLLALVFGLNWKKIGLFVPGFICGMAAMNFIIGFI